MILIRLFLISILLLCSCTSYFKRKDCEATNWFEHGYQIAMSGKRLNSDNFLLECKRVDAEISESQLDLGFKSGMTNYCKPDIVYATGKKGLFFNNEFCDPSMIKTLEGKHAEGVLAFCSPQNAFSFGASGGIYNQICPKTMESNFLGEFKKGRKKFLEQSIQENEKRLLSLNQEELKIQQMRQTKEFELRSAESLYLLRPKNSIQKPGEAVPLSPEEIRINDLKHEVNRMNDQLNSVSSQRKSLQEEIFRWKKEMITLE